MSGISRSRRLPFPPRMPSALWVCVLTGVAAAQQLPPPAAVVSTDSLRGYVRLLPPKRAAMGDIEHQKGLAAAEEVLVKTLRDLGLEPRLEPVAWNLRQQKELLEKYKKDYPGVEPVKAGPW